MTDTHTLLDILRTVEDPQLKRDIVSLGMVRDIQIRDGYAHIQLELAMNAEGIREDLKGRILEKTRGLADIKEVLVEFLKTSRAHSLEPTGPDGHENVRFVIAVASGKGGVGKTTVAVNLSLALRSLGFTVGLMDGDIYGPNVPLMLGVDPGKRPGLNEAQRIVPIEAQGIRMISMGVLVPAGQPVVWRGPKLHGIVSQFVRQVEWGALDFLIVDLPPGTGDVQLSLVQNVSLSGAVIVTTPQEVALMDACKAIAMFEQTKVPVLGMIENMTGEVFGRGGGRRAALEYKIPYLGEVPLDAKIRLGGDSGEPVVTAHPDSPAALAFLKAAGMLAQALNVPIHSGGVK
ncbi:MAG: Mrp/NBP35 family ATP-binding protein [Candidatus Omnitrophota bacterium]